MKKFIALALVLVMVFALTACGGKDEPKPSGNTADPGTQQTEPAITQQPTNAPDDSELDMTSWNYERYSAYTDGVPEPEFEYTLTGIISEMLAFKTEASVDEINA